MGRAASASTPYLYFPRASGRPRGRTLDAEKWPPNGVISRKIEGIYAGRVPLGGIWRRRGMRLAFKAYIRLRLSVRRCPRLNLGNGNGLTVNLMSRERARAGGTDWRHRGGAVRVLVKSRVACENPFAIPDDRVENNIKGSRPFIFSFWSSSKK